MLLTHHALRDRPNVAAVLVLASAVELGCLPLARPAYLTVEGFQGATSVTIAIALAVCAGNVWLWPQRARRGGWTAIAAGLLSFPFANLGGFLIGILLALVGGAFAVAWDPAEDPPGTDQ
ncbi:DUF6114 domain-containing protein [Streptomyces sp. GS7]|uniref:DUF6114 domain-containing protein n=1 Tax=Streptomyces sp. GS7 TaxID=2692234 RepID=UPI0013160349|nr:DUF6114 domain-containing protein [Streptomyces sp. GS7]QHC21482.1 hypothetical protein GR130_08685 [Streptomyces sp. GS7]